MAEVVTTHTQTNFDSQAYIDSQYTTFTGDKPEDDFTKFILDSLYGVFKDGAITGERLLDIGTGPGCHGVYSASKWFNDIVISDLSNENLAVLRKWKAGEIRHQESVFKYMMNLEGNREDVITCNRKLSEKISAIVQSDLHMANPLSGTELESMTFDAISLILSQNAASPTETQYEKSVRNYSQLLKPGGYLIVIDFLGEDHYTVGKYKFKVLNANREMLQRIYTEAGYQILDWKQGDPDQFVEYLPFVMVAKKQ